MVFKTETLHPKG